MAEAAIGGSAEADARAQSRGKVEADAKNGSNGSVYMPAEDSYLMLEALSECAPKAGDRVLDMGTGSGILAIAAAKAGCRVSAVDINPEAIRFAKNNAKKENQGIGFILSDLFQNVSGKFDLILFNAPYVKTEKWEKKDMRSAAWDGGEDGLETVGRFLRQAGAHLSPGGKILLSVSSSGMNPPEFPGFSQKVLKKKSYFFERLFVLELS